MRNIWDDYLIPLGAFLLLVLFLCANARSADFQVEFKPLPRHAVGLEVAWQIENLVDINQTLKIARDPADWREVGTMSLITGQHPTVRQVWFVSLATAVLHYGVSQVLENTDHPRLMAAWQLGTLGYKTWDINRNRENGL
jgi:hypothetical protein